MGNKLPSNFSCSKYGLFVRLVTEEDAAFIIKLRTDEKLSKFISRVDNDVNKQREWIREYKKREAIGTDYYFIYFYNDTPIGINRVYNVHDGVFTFGSWICLDKLPFNIPMATAIIAREIGFYELGCYKELEIGGTHVDNKKVLRFSEMLGMIYDGTMELEKGTYRTGYLTKEAFENHVDDVKRFIPNATI